MKKVFLIIALFLFSFPVYPQTAFNVWTPKGNVVNTASAGNQQVIYATTGCVVVASPCYRMWYVVNNTGNVNLLESLDGLTSWTAYSGNPVMTGVRVTTLWFLGGTYYLFAQPTTSGPFNAIAEWTSPTGIGSWTSIGTVLTTGSAGAWDSTVVAQLNLVDVVGGTWYAYYSGSNGTTYAGGLATSTNGTSWTKAVGQPSITGINSSSSAGYNFTRTGTTYYAYGQANYNNTQLSQSGNNFTSIFRWSSASPSGPWTQLSVNGNQVPTYYAATAADFFSTANNNQLGDPNILYDSINNRMLLYYDIGSGGSEGLINEAVATGVDPVQLAAGFEGVVGAPISGAPQLNENILGSDPGTGANANPAGGNWTTNPQYFAIQRASNLLEPASTTNTTAIAYWNAVTWNSFNDQWGQITASNCNSSSNVLSVVLRQSTSAKTHYRVQWAGTVGSSGTYSILKSVAGTGTSLATSSLTVSTTDTLGLAINGTNLYFYYNGILLAVATDSSITSGQAGLFLLGDSTSTSDASVSAWSGGNFQNAISLSNGTQIGGFIISKNRNTVIPFSESATWNLH